MSDAARPTMFVDGETLGSLCEITGRRVRQLVTEGVFPKANGGKFDAFVCVPAFYRWKTREDRRANEAGDLDPLQERARKDRALAISAEIKNDIATGRVVLADVAIASQVILCRKIKNKVEALPTRVATRGIACKTVAELHALVSRETELVLLELSNDDGLLTLNEIKAEIDFEATE